MAFLNWSGGSHIGVPTMDLEHGQLVKQMNELHARWTADAPRPIIARALQVLYDGTLTHFRHEEAHMRQHRHADYDAHCGIHRDLMETLTRFRDAFVKDGSALDPEFFDFLARWLSRHILEADASYANDLARAGKRHQLKTPESSPREGSTASVPSGRALTCAPRTLATRTHVGVLSSRHAR